ncbi:MAG: 1-acyl-sn-glycerol-3-phosphate acyltransferase [Sphingomonadaceae bacterium]|uniref:lysophospholipid acyltransferase family protein n=1 Tax=Thermaurantiacus sp. TaxID=2820283 RepID=UPI00298F3CD9|nr:lysophospholipid acyltransferase family protein [Thermaurantiacus sp.]MCS6985917.1 1-acyl-sn-glycerol-3-phosphate acyltransferase [Sphingomonadaceae bacterium]MDW8414867.1 lysophospholipid acyltransferase family protein [Thermaurantiacus sp.]
MQTAVGLVAATGTLVPAFVGLKAMAPGLSARVPLLYHAALLRAFGVSVDVEGKPVSGGVLYVANHLSWLDIPVLGSKLQAVFVAKHEVGQMPFVRTLANLAGTIYVDRQRRSLAPRQAETVASHLARGGNVILFPEGTSNDGLRILPFKPTLFAGLDGALGRRVRVQPVSIAYTEVNAMPLTRNRQLEIAWIGDMALAPHALALSRMGRIRARILCHEPVRPADFPDRKALARHCRQVVEAGYRRLVRGPA